MVHFSFLLLCYPFALPHGHTHIHTHTHACTPTHMHAHIDTHARMHTQSHKLRHTCTHTHPYTRRHYCIHMTWFHTGKHKVCLLVLAWLHAVCVRGCKLPFFVCVWVNMDQSLTIQYDARICKQYESGSNLLDLDPNISIVVTYTSPTEL